MASPTDWTAHPEDYSGRSRDGPEPGISAWAGSSRSPCDRVQVDIVVGSDHLGRLSPIMIEAALVLPLVTFGITLHPPPVDPPPRSLAPQLPHGGRVPARPGPRGRPADPRCAARPAELADRRAPARPAHGLRRAVPGRPADPAARTLVPPRTAGRQRPGHAQLLARSPPGTCCPTCTLGPAGRPLALVHATRPRTSSPWPASSSPGWPAAAASSGTPPSPISTPGTSPGRCPRPCAHRDGQPARWFRIPIRRAR